MSLNRYFLRLAYNGSKYHGWQSQNNATTIQEMLNHAISLLVSEQVSLTGAGRTDTGVHAREFYAHFDLSRQLDEQARKKLVFKLNGFLPEDIVIFEIMPVKPEANARFSALSRTYKYVISTKKNPFLEGFSYYLFGNLDIGLMNRGAEILLETKDFTSFSKVDTDTKTNICKVYHAAWAMKGDELIFTIKADRFLRNMVRAIVGTLLELGRTRITLDEFKVIIESKNRSAAGGSVPACGLYLEEIEYPSEVFLLHH
ncbi:MAG: tRNA pseudouridine(38-40) synthase TruA [Bacteroidetes bacterium]|nr:tRNA pseudouridine(38-40) synthase TruA [Bacteroidota bacterium]